MSVGTVVPRQVLEQCKHASPEDCGGNEEVRSDNVGDSAEVNDPSPKLNTRAKGGDDGVVVGVRKSQQLEGILRDFEKGPLPHGIGEALDKACLAAEATAPSYWR